jgi:hypothetical protein
MAGWVEHVGGRKVHTKFWWGNPMEKYHLENLGIKCEGNIKMDF